MSGILFINTRHTPSTAPDTASMIPLITTECSGATNPTMVIAAVVIAVLILITSIAFAALSQTLNISTNKVTQSAQSWNIGFEAGTINGVLTATDPRMATCGAATVTSDTITGVSVVLENIGDKCAYTFNLIAINSKNISIV